MVTLVFLHFSSKRAWLGDGLQRASGAERTIFTQYNVHGRISSPINMVMVMVIVYLDKYYGLLNSNIQYIIGKYLDTLDKPGNLWDRLELSVNAILTKRYDNQKSP